MTTQERQLPDNDRDLLLARQIGEALENRSGLDSLQDTLPDELFDYKKAELDEISSTEWSSELWENIEHSTKARQKARVLPFYKNSGFVKFAVAATVLIAAFTGLFLYNQSRPVVVGESLAEISEVVLQDGSLVTLRPYSTLLALGSDPALRSYRIIGEGFFDVEHDPERPFSVEAGAATATVLGTRFNLSSWGDAPAVYLQEGSVRFESKNRQSVILEPGEAASLSDGALVKRDASVAQTYTDWMNNLLMLDNTTISKALDELEQHYNITIHAEAIPDPDELLGGTIILGDTDSTLSDLGIILGGTFRKTGEQNYRFIPLN